MIWRFIHVDNKEGLELTRKEKEKEQQWMHKRQQLQERREEPKEEENNPESLRKKTTITNGGKSTTSKPTVDVKGAIALAIAISSFLLVLTYLEIGSSGNNNNDNSISTISVAIFLASGIISLTLFILIEKRSVSPLFNYGLMSNKRILLANIIIVIVGFSMFIVFQTIPILVENPKPVGFGGDPISAANTQLPFALVFLVFGPVSGLLISKLGSVKPMMIGTVVGAIGFFLVMISHSTEVSLSINLAIISVGLALSNVGAQNVIILSIPRQNSGASLGMTSFIRIVGSSIAPALSGMFMQGYQYTVDTGGKLQSYPSSEAYNLIFLTATILSIVSILLTVILYRTGPPKCQNHLPEEKGDMSTKITENIKEEILSWPGVTSNPYHYGGIEFRVDKRDMGHIHPPVSSFLKGMSFQVSLTNSGSSEYHPFQHQFFGLTRLVTRIRWVYSFANQ
jgi:hypothetical protein